MFSLKAGSVVVTQQVVVSHGISSMITIRSRLYTKHFNSTQQFVCHVNFYA